MGLSSLVYPGAHHSRFEHALGVMFLMQKAIAVLRIKGTTITDDEAQALQIVALLHDVGHGPFSHAMEHSLLKNTHHETLSLLLMKHLNTVFDGQLDLAIAIYTNSYNRQFMHQLISSQVDVDRLDYLKRDSFYTGATEGNINSERIIAMMQVEDDQLVFEEKGVYSLEKFLLARRLMYWQVYLHKTGLSAELTLVRCVQRARELLAQGVDVAGAPSLLFFLKNEVQQKSMDSKVLIDHFVALDDHDIYQALKLWQNHDDFVLSYLAKAILQRKLLHLELRPEVFTEDTLTAKKKHYASWKLSPEALDCIVFKGAVQNQVYQLTNAPIQLITKSKDLLLLQAHHSFGLLQNYSGFQEAHYMCYPKS